MLKLDHLAIIAPTLEAGADYIRTQLGVDMQKGGEHPQMGTHNLLLRLGEDVYLEVIAINPAAPAPRGPRWFGLDELQSVQSAWEGDRRLRGWIAQTDNIDAALAHRDVLLGRKTLVSRGDRSWYFSLLPDGSLPAGGALPSVIEWRDRTNPASQMPDCGTVLRSFEIEHPDPDWVSQLYTQLEIVDPPKIRKGEQLRYRAAIETPLGLRELY
ncbi:hypothetical protein N182_37565 [Sinorhizobium sp. GL2]|nr:hypothetical protein N182_37565 [Sinorhizobium sp. GL2]